MSRCLSVFLLSFDDGFLSKTRVNRDFNEYKSTDMEIEKKRKKILDDEGFTVNACIGVMRVSS